MVKCREAVKQMNLLDWEEGKVASSKAGDIKLLFGENLVPVSSKVKKAIISELNNLNIYPEPQAAPLISALSRKLNLPETMIVAEAGIDGILNLIAKTFIEKGDEVIVPMPTFPVYETVSKIMGANVKKIVLDKDFKLSIPKLQSLITDKTKAIFIANPNNPTGNILLSNTQIKRIASVFNGLLIIDECYCGISTQTAVNLVKENKNIFVLCSFSKSVGLAGLRVGYAVGCEELIKPMKALLVNCEPFALNRLAQVGAVAALEDNFTLKKFLQLKLEFCNQLSSVKGLKLIPTQTTFILLDLRNSGITADMLRDKLAKKRIFVKDASVYGLSKWYARLGVPKRQDIPHVVREIKAIIYKVR